MRTKFAILYHEFKIANSFSRIKIEVITSFLQIFMNSFTRTSFLFAKLRIHSYEFVRVFSMLGCEWPVLYDWNKEKEACFQELAENVPKTVIIFKLLQLKIYKRFS